MSDNWAMDLAREEQVYSSPDSSVSPISWTYGYPSLESPDASSGYEYVEQGIIPLSDQNAADDGYATCSSNSPNSADACSEIGQEETDKGEPSTTKPSHSIKDDAKKIIRNNTAKRLAKNKNQRLRVSDRNKIMWELKHIIAASDLVQAKPKGTRFYTELTTLKYARLLIQQLIARKNQQ